MTYIPLTPHSSNGPARAAARPLGAVDDLAALEAHIRSEQELLGYTTQRPRDSGTQGHKETQRDSGTQRHSDSLPPLEECVTVSPCVTVSTESQGVEFLTGALSVALQSPRPAAARYHLERLNQLVMLCAELQHLAGDRPFFAGCRDLGKVLGVSFQVANKWLRRLVMDGVLVLISKGSQATRRASEYRFTAN
jgi:hypothetical protein